MNEQILIDIINNATQFKHFVLDQLPDVLQQLLRWKLVESVVHNVVAMAIAIAWFKFTKFFLNRHSEMGLYDGGRVGIEISIGIVSTVSLITLVVFINITWLKILVSPKVYLIEYAASLVK